MSGGLPAMFSTIVFTAFIVAAFYFILLRPVLQQQRRQRRDLSQLQVGDRVLTQAGFLATVKEIHVPAQGPVEIVLELAKGVEVRALPMAISQRLGPAGEPRSPGGSSEMPRPVGAAEGLAASPGDLRGAPVPGPDGASKPQVKEGP